MYRLYALFLIAALFGNHTTYSMDELIPLSRAEQFIFFDRTLHIGIESMAKELNRERAKDFFCLSIELKFYPTKIDKLITQNMYKEIIKHEALYGYLPNGKRDNATGELLIQPTNHLGYYTRYWYGTDEKGSYIKCVFEFTQKEVLKKALNDIKEITHYKSNL